MRNLDTLQKILTERRSKWHNVSTLFLPLFETHKGIIALWQGLPERGIRSRASGWKCVAHMLYTDTPLTSKQSCLKIRLSSRRERFPMLWYLVLFQSRTEKVWISCFLMEWTVWKGFNQEMTKSFVLLKSTESWICLRVILTHRSCSSSHLPHPEFPRLGYITYAELLLLWPIYDLLEHVSQRCFVGFIVSPQHLAHKRYWEREEESRSLDRPWAGWFNLKSFHYDFYPQQIVQKFLQTAPEKLHENYF